MKSYPESLSSIHQAAVEIAGKGIAVFPVKPDKSPHTSHGFHDATVDPAKVNLFWNRWRGAAIGVPTGDVSGLVVLDIDVDPSKGLDGEADLRELETENGELPRTKTVRTPRGGRHLYFRCPAGARGRNLTPALEVKANGQYVIVPPSAGYKVIDNAPIAEAPECLFGADNDPSGFAGRDCLLASSRPVNDGGTIPQGERNRTLFFFALDLKDAGYSREDALERTLEANAARCKPPLSEQEVERIVKSAMRYPVRSGKPSPEVEEFVDKLEADWWSRDWKGIAGKTDRDGKRVLIELARRYGRLTPDGQAVEVSASVRTVALAAATSYVTVSRGITKRLAQSGQVVKLDAGRGPLEAATWRLFATAQPANTQPSGGGTNPEMPCVNKLSALQRKRLWDLETPAFRWRGLVGKGRGGVLYVLEAYGPLTEADIAKHLGISRVRNVRRYLRGYHDKRRGIDVHGLLDLGLVEECAGLLSLPADYQNRIEEVRNTRYASERKRRTTSPEEGRTVTDVETGVSLSEVEREVDDLRRHRDQQEKFNRHLAELRLIESTHFEDLSPVLARSARAERKHSPVRLTEDEERDADAILAYEAKYGRGSFGWDKASCKRLFYEFDRWPDTESIGHIRDYLGVARVAA